VDFLGGEQREIFPQIKPRLRAEHGIGTGAGAVGLGFSVFQNVSQQIEVLNHRGENLTTKYTKYTKRNLATGWTCSVSSLFDPFRAGLEFRL
jgi:hypothetical protein